MSKRFKILLSSLAVLTAATPLASTMVSCGDETKNENLPIIPNMNSFSEYSKWSDTKFHVTADTMSEMVDDLKVKYDLKLFNDGITDEHVRSQLVAKEMKSFTESFEKAYVSQVSNDLRSYSLKTNAFKKAVASHYGITLNRITNTTWGDIEDFFNNSATSFKAYMDRMHMSDSLQNSVVNDAWRQFNAMRTLLNKQEMYVNDPLLALDYVREHIFECFSSINAEVSKLASMQKIKDFLHKYSFSYIDKKDDQIYNANRMDKLDIEESELFKEGKDISSLMNKIFIVHDKETDKDVTFDQQTMIPGFAIRPILQLKTYDKYQNNFAIGIDWTCVKNGTPKKDIENATGHLYGMHSEFVAHDNVDTSKSLLEILNECEHTTSTYNFFVTEKQEVKNLHTTYFDSANSDGCIKFRWPKADPEDKHQAWDQFYANIPYGQTKGTMNMQILASAGLQMSDDNGHNWKYLSDWIAESQQQIAEANEQHEFIDDEKTSLGFKFIQNCDLNANVQITDPGEARKAETRLFVSYKNSFTKQIYNIDFEPYAHTSSGYLASTLYFFTASQNFNHVCNFLGRYSPDTFDKSNGFIEDAREAAITSIIADSVELAIVAGTLAYFTYKLIVACMPFDPDPGIVIFAGIGIGACLATAAFIGVRLGFMVEKYKKPIEKFNDRMKDLQDSSEFKNIVSIYNKEDEETFLKIDNDGKYDEDEYKRKLEKYQSKDFDKFRLKANGYIFFFDNSDVDTFVDLTVKTKTDDDAFNDIVDPWDVGGKYFWMDIGTALGEIIGGLGQSFAYERIAGIEREKDAKMSHGRKFRSKAEKEAFKEKVENEIREDMKRRKNDPNFDGDLDDLVEQLYDDHICDYCELFGNWVDEATPDLMKFINEIVFFGL